MSIIGLGVGEAIGGVAQGAGNAALGTGMAAQGAGHAVSGIAQGAGVVLSKLGEVLLSPIGMLCDWAREPLKRAEHKRLEESEDRRIEREVRRETGVQKVLSEQKMKEAEFSANLKIKRETEIIRIITEIEQLKKDKEFERMKAVSNAMMRYQKELTRINVEAVDAIYFMSIELRRKAHELIYEKTQQYNELQNIAIQQAGEQLGKIDNNPAMTEITKNILRNSIDKKLTGVIDNAIRFIEQLNDDMQLISKDINLITSSGQQFIERHLSQFQLIGFSGEAISTLSGSEHELLP